MSDELNRRNFIADSGFLAARKGNNHGIGGDPGHGMQFHGTDATLYLDRGGFQVIPERQRTAAIKSGSSDQNWPHVQDFLKCVKSRAVHQRRRDGPYLNGCLPPWQHLVQAGPEDLLGRAIRDHRRSERSSRRRGQCPARKRVSQRLRTAEGRAGLMREG